MAQPGSNPGVDAICGLSLLLVLSLAPRGFSPGTPVFPSPQKPTFPNSNSIRVDEEPLVDVLPPNHHHHHHYYYYYYYWKNVNQDWEEGVTLQVFHYVTSIQLLCVRLRSHGHFSCPYHLQILNEDKI